MVKLIRTRYCPAGVDNQGRAEHTYCKSQRDREGAGRDSGWKVTWGQVKVIVIGLLRLIQHHRVVGMMAASYAAPPYEAVLVEISSVQCISSGTFVTLERMLRKTRVALQLKLKVKRMLIPTSL